MVDLGKVKKVISYIVLGAVFVFLLSRFFKIEDEDRVFRYKVFCVKNKIPFLKKSFLKKPNFHKPAGKYGFVCVRNGHFFLENGKRAKFWGTNLCFSACFPNHNEAEQIAKRIFLFGFNAVRLHHLDFYPTPNGIFDGENNTIRLSESQLDKLDYLIFQLKKRGIYVNLNLLVSRHFKKDDGVVCFSELDSAGKPMCVFDKRLIDLQKDYAKKLLLHKNKYTNRQYNNEPAIAMVEIINELSLYYDWTKNKLKKMPRFYKNELNSQWVVWCKKNGVKSSQFPFFYSKYLNQKLKIYVRDFLSDVEKRYFSEMVSFLKNSLHLKVPIGCGGHFSRPNLKNQAETLDFLNLHIYWDHPTFYDGKWSYSYFKIKNAPLDERKAFAKIKIYGYKKPIVISEWNQCYPNEYAFQMPLLIAEKAKEADYDAVFQFAFLHNKNNFNKCKITNFFDISENPQQLILCYFASNLFLKEKTNFNYSINNSFALINFKNKSIRIGKVKNAKSRFLGHRFLWGENKVLLQFSIRCHFDGCFKLLQSVLPTCPHKEESRKNKTLSLSHSESIKKPSHICPKRFF